MGLLSSSDNQRPRPFQLLQSHVNWICLVLYPAGIIVFCALANSLYNDRTYFSDNSLLPGMVVRSTGIAQEAESLLEDLEAEAKKHAGIPYPWLMAQFRQAGLEVYRHNFSLNYPLGAKALHRGENLYAILRAPRAARTEAMVLSTPYRTSINPHGATLPSIASMISLARHFRRQLYWSKDIIFLVVEHEQVGLQAWLDAYHMVSTSPGVIDPGRLDARSGNIMAALNLELQDKHIDQVNVKILGLNGQLPNLDMVNTCYDLLLRERIPNVLEGKADPIDSESFEGWLHAGTNLLNMMSKQAAGTPSAAHGLYHRFAIQALTLQGEPKKRGYQHVTLNHVGRVIEGMVRSVNNLLQRFHRSFFYYLLPTSGRYISIAYYMSAFALIASPAVLKASALLLDLSDLPHNAYLTLIWKALPLVFVVQGFGIGIFATPAYGEHAVKRFLPYSTQDALYAYVLGATGIMLVLPFITKRTIHPEPQRLIMLLHYSLVLGPLAILNISMASLVAVVTLPVVITAGVQGRNIIFRSLHRILQLIINPLCISFLILLVHSLSLDDWNFSNVCSNLSQAFEGHKKLLLFSVEDWYLYGSANYPLLCLAFLPLWAHMWSL